MNGGATPTVAHPALIRASSGHQFHDPQDISRYDAPSLLVKRDVVTAAAALMAVIAVLFAPWIGNRDDGNADEGFTELGRDIEASAERLCRWMARAAPHTGGATDALETHTDRLHARFGGNWRVIRSEIISRQGEICRAEIERTRRRS